jgi:hypothetical protein
MGASTRMTLDPYKIGCLDQRLSIRLATSHQNSSFAIKPPNTHLNYWSPTQP